MKNGNHQGFSLIEVLVAMLLLTIMALFLCRLLLAGVQLNYVSRDETQMNTVANDRLEQLKNMSFSNLGIPCLNSSASCGNLDNNYTDTSVTPNIRYYDDSVTGYDVRWMISLPEGNQNTRRITVRAVSKNLKAVGKQRELVIYYDRTKY